MCACAACSLLLLRASERDNWIDNRPMDGVGLLMTQQAHICADEYRTHASIVKSYTSLMTL
jgi:hypothetical protein